jgi:hypothetical protein
VPGALNHVQLAQDGAQVKTPQVDVLAPFEHCWLQLLFVVHWLQGGGGSLIPPTQA